MNSIKRPKTVNIIAILTVLTVSRLMAITFLPTLNRFGGTSPDAWLAPWITDSILGILLPVAIYAILKRKGIKTWGLLIIYSTLGAFDYATGLVVEWQTPLPDETAAPTLVFGSLIATLVFQTIAIFLLFNKEVIIHFQSEN